MKKKGKDNISMAIGMLQLILKNKWIKEEKSKREKASIDLARMYILEAEKTL